MNFFQVKCGILTDPELVNVFMYLSGEKQPNSSVQFNTIPRCRDVYLFDEILTKEEIELYKSTRALLMRLKQKANLVL